MMKRFYAIGRPDILAWMWLSGRKGETFAVNWNPREGDTRRYTRKRDAYRAVRRIAARKGHAFADTCHICPFDPK